MSRRTVARPQEPTNARTIRDVDVAPSPAGILALAVASLADIPASERDLLTRKLEERER
ncbi:MAG TPA: hypothetical protein VNN08_09735 [Thermoanaerobaculia bacterium]|nr:hypothetical protein [Thermoanaerobaculia bacterium]